MTICKRVCYSGRVQGVGFRYATQELAGSYVVSGYVKNLANGEVELVAQGEQEYVNALLAAVAARMARYIDRATVDDEVPGNYSGFHIRY